MRCELLVLEERYSQQRLPDELAQNIARRGHDCARVRIAEEAKFQVNPELKRQIRDALGKFDLNNESSPGRSSRRP